MIRHVALFTLREDAPADTSEQLCDALARLPDAIQEIRAYSFGPDLGLREGNHDFGVVADFDDAEAFARYVAHPAHQAFLTEHLQPVLAGRVSIQFEH